MIDTHCCYDYSVNQYYLFWYCHCHDNTNTGFLLFQDHTVQSALFIRSQVGHKLQQGGDRLPSAHTCFNQPGALGVDGPWWPLMARSKSRKFFRRCATWESIQIDTSGKYGLRGKLNECKWFISCMYTSVEKYLVVLSCRMAHMDLSENRVPLNSIGLSPLSM